MKLPKFKNLLLPFVLFILITLSILGFLFEKKLLNALKFLVYFINDYKIIGTFIYVAVVAIWITFLLPLILAQILAGIIFTPLPFAIFIIFCACQLAIIIIYTLANSVLKNWLQKQFHNDQKVKAINQAFSEQGSKLVVLLRLTPVPFGLMTYILSTTDIKLHSLLIGTIGLLPGITLHVLVGALTRSANNSKTPLRVSLLTGVIGFSFALLAFVCITCVARRALRSVVHLDTAEEEVDVQSIDLLNDSGSVQSNRLEMGALDNISSLNDSVCDTEVIDTSANGDISSNQVMEESSSMKDNSIPFETQSTVVLENSSCCSITQSSTTQISPALNPTINATKKCSIDVEQDQSNCLVQNNQLEQPLPNNTHEHTHSTLILQQTDSQPVKIHAVFTTGEKIAMMVVSCISFLALTIGIPVILLNTTSTGTTWGNP